MYINNENHRCVSQKVCMKNVLSDLRQMRGLTQQELGEWVGVSRQTIISLESGRYNPSLHLAHRLSVFFETPIEEIFLFDDENSYEAVEPESLDRVSSV